MELSVEDGDKSTEVDQESDLDYISGIRGYEVTAIVACFLIISAIFMCYLTWKFRYKIVLRTVTHKTTVVENLVAQTLQQTLDFHHQQNQFHEHHHHGYERRRSSVANTSRPRARLSSLTLTGPHPLTQSVVELEDEKTVVVADDPIDLVLEEINGEVVA